jgi:uncharacterized protein (DUF4415 family)/uncharacterized DUF497 family protein
MKINFDAVKNEKNIQERNLNFERVAEFDFETAQFDIDTRYSYGETLYRAMGFLDKRLHSLVFVEIMSGIRVISFKKKPTNVSLNAMKTNQEVSDNENPEWTDQDFKNSTPFTALTESLQTTLRQLKVRGKQLHPTKVSTTVRFDAEVLEAFKNMGNGWQTRMNNALKEWLKEHTA